MIKTITDYFGINEKEAPNPDPQHNANLLLAARNKVETGIFTRFFKRPVITALEIICYLLAVILFIAGFLVFYKNRFGTQLYSKWWPDT